MNYDRIIQDALRLARAPRRFALGGEADPKDISPSISNPVSVFPKPQRMFPSDAPVPGGQYLGMPDKQDMTGHKSAVASIGVHPGGKPYFNASRDAVDQTGTAGKAKTKTNLFKQKAGWSWQTAPEGHEDTNTIVSVEHRGKHYYTLNAHFPKGVDFARYAESRSEPRLRPTTTGDVFLGPQAGTISVRGKEHPVYHHVVVKADGGAVGYASGGETKKSSSREENFRNWFGNSKAIDGEGKPWVHYHATAKDFSQFIPGGRDPSFSGPAIWLTPHKHSQSAGHNIMSGRGQFKEGANVKPLYVKIEKPLHVDESDPEGKEELRKKFGAKSYGWPMTIHPEDVKKMKEAGYDGIFHLTHRDAETGASKPFNRETGEGLETIVFDPYQVKSAIGNIGEFNPKSHDITKSHGGMTGYASGGDVDQPRKLDDMGFYSSAAESARSLPQSKGTPQQMLATMKGVKPAELEWSGVQDKFAGQKSVTKDDLAQHFEQNVPQIRETVLGGKDNENARKYIINEYSARKRELEEEIEYDPDSEEAIRAKRILNNLQDEMEKELENYSNPTKYQEYTVGPHYDDESVPTSLVPTANRNYREVLLHLPGEKKFQSAHWDPANIVAHLRMQDRGPDNNILHLEELQSDWAQQGRDEGFKDPKHEENYAKKLDELRNAAHDSMYKEAISNGTTVDWAEKFASKFKNMTHDEVAAFYPDNAFELDKLFEKFRDNLSKIEPSPYVTNTDHWVELGLKRALLEAARGGYDKLVWTPGEEQAKRYDLSKQVNKITYHPLDKAFNAYDKRGRNVIYENDVEPHDIKKYIGNELAERLLEESNYSKSLLDEYEVLRHPDSNKWGLYLYGEPSHDYGGGILEFDSKSDAREHLNDKLREEIDRHPPSLEGLDLKVGGEGMKSFYDKMLPSALRRVLKPHTDKIQPTSHVVKGNDGEDVTLPGIEITPELRESILKRGFSYYARGGEVRQHFEDGGGAEGGSPAGDTGGSMGDTTGQDSSGPEATQDSPAFTTEAPQLGLMDTARSAVHGTLGTGPGIVGVVAGSPLGALAYGMEAINNAYYDGKARADIDPNAGGPGGQESGFAPPQPPKAPGSGFRLSNDDEETQAGMVKPVGFAPPPAPMMAEGGAVPMASGGEAEEKTTGRPLSDKETNDLVGKIQSVLTPDLLEPKYRKQSEGQHPTFGHCASATQAAYYMLGGRESGYVPQVAKEDDGTTHWWLRHRQTGHVIDPTKEQYTSQGEKPPYDRGRGCGFPNPNPDAPSKRGQEIIDRIQRRYEMGGAVPMASGGEAGDTQSMPQLTSEQQSLLDQLSRAIDRVYPAMDAAEARQPVIRHEPTMPGEPALTREQHQEYNIGQLQNALARVPTDYPTGPVGYAEGGSLRKGISDWKWKPLSRVRESIGVSEIPSHVQDFGKFMDETANKASGEGLSVRDLIKAYTITRSSIRRAARKADTVRNAGLNIPDSITGMIRPEGAFGHWLHTSYGQNYLNDAEKGRVNEDAIKDAVRIMRPFGGQNQLVDALTWAVNNLPGQEKKFSELVSRAQQMQSSPSEWRELVKPIKGIRESKAGFMASMIGRGDQPTLDARQIVLHTGRPSDEASKYLSRSGAGASAVDRLARRQKALDLTIPQNLSPYYQHLAHHTIWDKVGNETTTHQDVIDAMRGAASGGAISSSILSHPVASAMRALGFKGIDGEESNLKKNESGVVSRALMLTSKKA